MKRKKRASEIEGRCRVVADQFRLVFGSNLRYVEAGKGATCRCVAGGVARGFAKSGEKYQGRRRVSPSGRRQSAKGRRFGSLCRRVGFLRTM